MVSDHPSEATLAKRNRELAILNTIAEALNREIRLGPALEATLAHVVDLCSLRTGWIWLLDEQGEPSLAAIRHLPPALADNPERMRGTCYCLDTYRAGGLEQAANISVITCSRLKGLIDGTDGLRYHASIPLGGHGRRWGVLNVASTDWHGMTDDDLRLLYTIGDLLSIAIERSRLFAQSAAIGALEERNRLARDIHDTITRSLAAIHIQLEIAQQELAHHTDAEQARNAIDQALKLSQASLDAAYRSIQELHMTPLPGSAATKLVDEMRRPTTAILTIREREVLQLIARGHPNKEIAALLGITERTVKFHASAIFQQLSVKNRTEAVRRAGQLGLIDI